MRLSFCLLSSLLGCSSQSSDQKQFKKQQLAILQQALSPTPQSESLIWAYRSADGRSWSRQAKPVAHGFTSLGLSIDKGVLRLSGQHHLQPPTAAEEQSGYLWTQSLLFDGQTWRAHIEFFTDPATQAHADDQWFQGQLWYYAPQKQLLASQSNPPSSPTDPLLQSGLHAIRSTPPATLRVQGKGLGDPSPVWFQSQLHLFTTRFHGPSKKLEVVHFAGPNLTQRNSFAAVSVPYAVTHEDQLWLLAQGMHQGRLQPMISRSTDGQRWSKWQPVVDIQPSRNCTSPVIGKFQSSWWLFCVEDRRHHH